MRVINQGNIHVSGRLEVQANTIAEAVSYVVALGPGEKQEHPYPVEAIYHKRSDGSIEATERVTLKLSYTDLVGKTRTKRKRVSVKVKPRADVVEMDFGGLDDLEI